MEHVLLVVADDQVVAMLTAGLGSGYEVVRPAGEIRQALEQPFDLLIVDEAGLAEFGPRLIELRQAAEPLLLPIALICTRALMARLDEPLPLVDELIALPIAPVELRLRVATLLRYRRLSRDLQQRNDDLQAFIHAMSHDLRAPLAVMNGFSSMLLETHSEHLDEPAQRALRGITTAGQHMSGLISALLDFSRLGRERIPLGPVPLQPLVYNCMQILDEQIRARSAHIEVAAPLPVVRGNQALLQMALLNLLGNAVKYVPSDVCPQVSVAAHPLATGYRVEVSDNGIGISAADQQRLFNPFVRLKRAERYGGVGLGLATVRKAAEIMGGTVGVQSQAGAGSTFWLDLPAADTTDM